MESIFDIFFEHKMEMLPRCGLKTRQNRTDVVDHLNAVISGYAEGQNVPADVACQLAVTAAINFHKKQKSENSKICMMGKYHNVLYVALKIAWDWGVRDSETVCQLLEEIHSCEGTFERIFLGAIFGTNAPHFIAGWKADFKDQEENCLALVFFLQHATRFRVTFPRMVREGISGKPLRFIDVPIESCGKSSPIRVALQVSSPELLLLLLRYGANPSPSDEGYDLVVALLDKLLEYEKDEYPIQLISCLRILNRAIPLVDLPFKPLVFRIRRERCLEKYGSLIANGVLPLEALLGVPPTLKALCRFTIREHLRQNFQLPDGIRRLKIPTTLQEYVDLLDEVEGE